MEMNKKYFLHLEGMDLAGKSTIARKIKERSNLEWVINNNRLTEKNSILPKTGNRNIIIMLLVIVSVIAIVLFVRYRNIKDI